MTRQPSLGVCVVGRNEAENLRELGASLSRLCESTSDCEVVYVDAGSSDQSTELARSWADVIVELSAAACHSAAAARREGTELCNADWILYLDGDMLLTREFADFVGDGIQVASEEGAYGFRGYVHDIHPSGNIVLNRYKDSAETVWCSHFGGAVVLRRELVLKVGNWESRFWAWEEVELRSRLTSVGSGVRFFPVPMVYHRDAGRGTIALAMAHLWPWTDGVRQFSALGCVVMSKLRRGGLGAFAAQLRELYWGWGAVALGTVAVLMRPEEWWIVALGICLLWTLRFGTRGPVVCTGMILQVAAGMVLRTTCGAPHVVGIHRRSESGAWESES